MHSRSALVAGLLLASATLFAQTYPAPPFTPPAGHPRLYLTAKDLPRIRANAKKPQNAAAWEAHLRYLAKGTDGVLPAAAASRTNADSAVLVIIESYAFDYALNGSDESGRKAIRAMRNYIRTLSFPESDYNNAGQTVFDIGLVYDWCHPLLTAEDRQAFYEAAIRNAGYLEVGWPPVKQGNVTGHGPEGQIFRDLLAAAVAMYDEYPDVYNQVGGRFFARMVEPKKFMFRAHMHSQGSHYVNYRGQWEMLATSIFDRMGLPEVFGPDQRWFMYWTLYARRPDGQVLRDGDTHINNNAPGAYYTGPLRAMFHAANYFRDPYLKDEAMRELPNLAPDRPRTNQSINPTEILLFNDPDLAPAPPADLPLSIYFPSPKGAMIARTGWETGQKSGAVVAEMKINEWFFGNHQHLDAGAFQIYYRGALATDTGYYQAAQNSTSSKANDGNSGYGSAHDFNYHKRSIAHNTIQVFDPAEKFAAGKWKDGTLSNDGGQRMPSDWTEAKELSDLLDPKNGYRIGEVLGHGFGPDAKQPDYTYLKGDLARAYSPAKVKAYERSFVFLNLKQAAHPAAIVVLDRVVSSDPKFRKTWLLHGLEQPHFEGSRTVFKDMRAGYTGKLTVDTLLPEASDTQITAVGGPGHEAWVNGVNYPATTRPGGNNEGGGWRIEVSPRTARETDYFLHVLQVGDHTPDTPALPVRRVDTKTHTGASFGGRIVLLGKERGRSSAPVTVQVESTASILVADLTPGTWTVERDGRPAGTVTVTAEQGVVWLPDAQPGSWTFSASSR